VTVTGLGTETGRVGRRDGRADGERKLCSLYLSLLDRMGKGQRRSDFRFRTTPLNQRLVLMIGRCIKLQFAYRFMISPACGHHQNRPSVRRLTFWVLGNQCWRRSSLIGPTTTASGKKQENHRYPTLSDARLSNTLAVIRRAAIATRTGVEAVL
jgi:hypothetical protein